MRGLPLCVLLVTASVAGACQEPDQTYGEPNAIIGKKLPQEGDPPPSASSGGGVITTTLSMKSAHEGKGGPAPGAKINCLDPCHKAGGTGPEFSFGGQSIVGATIAVSGKNPVGCDADGYFWLKGGPLPAGSKATVGKGEKSKSMSGALSGIPGGSCDATACHGNPGTLPINPDSE